MAKKNTSRRVIKKAVKNLATKKRKLLQSSAKSASVTRAVARKAARIRKPIKLNLGGGEVEIPGYTNIDRKLGKEAYPLEYADNSIDEIRASHILEHFPHGLGVKVVKDWVRTLKPGGIMRIAVPDMDWIVDQYHSRTSGAPVEAYLMGGQTDKNDIHFAIYNRRKLWGCMREAGLIDIQPWTSAVQDCAVLPVSLNLQGMKAPLELDIARIKTPAKVSAAMSVPRLGFMANYFSAYQACLPLGIKLRMIEGAYWHQALEECIGSLVEVDEPPDFIMTVDYDSVFKQTDVEALIRIMVEHPDVDALCPIQSRRNNEYPLMSVTSDIQIGKTDCVAWESFEPLRVQIRTGHFGLTMLRVSSLLDVPHPWFLPIPNKEGKWGDNRVDADVNFWHTWEKHDKTLFLANRIIIGHCELMVAWPGKDFKPIHQHIEDYNANDRPPGVWE